MDSISFSPQLLAALQNARRVVLLTGAGVSAESGVPTFRGTDGIWKKFKPEELATFDAFMANPQLVWEWYNHRRQIIRDVKPNPGHYAIAEMAALFPHFTLVTQNVDGLHLKAGSPEIYELHGNIHRNRCLDCGATDFADDFAQIPPYCSCGGRLRPDVVWFGETLPEDSLHQAILAAQHADLFFTVGTSGAVQPAASLPLWAKQNGALLVEINLEPSEISYLCDITYHGKSGEILPQIVAKIKELKTSSNSQGDEQWRTSKAK
jgi:NAD-dependent deacetylase